MRRFVLLAAVLMTAAACGDATAPNGSVVGTYQLRTINGQTLPYTFTDRFGDVESLTSDQLTLNSDGSYQDLATVTGQSQPSIEEGFYTSVNGSISFDDRTDGITYSGSLSGNVLTEISNNGTLVEVFER